MRAYPIDVINAVKAKLDTDLGAIITTVNTERTYTGDALIPQPELISTGFRGNQFPEITIGVDSTSEYETNDTRPYDLITETFNIFVGFVIKGANAYVDRWMYGYKEAIERVVNNMYIIGVTNILVVSSEYDDSAKLVDNENRRSGVIYFQVRIN